MNGNIWAKIEVNALVWELMQRGYNIYRNDNNGERVELTEDNYSDYTD